MHTFWKDELTNFHFGKVFHENFVSCFPRIFTNCEIYENFYCFGCFDCMSQTHFEFDAYFWSSSTDKINLWDNEQLKVWKKLSTGWKEDCRIGNDKHTSISTINFSKIFMFSFVSKTMRWKIDYFVNIRTIFCEFWQTNSFVQSLSNLFVFTICINSFISQHCNFTRVFIEMHRLVVTIPVEYARLEATKVFSLFF